MEGFVEDFYLFIVCGKLNIIYATTCELVDIHSRNRV
jgi:hypothetical protein